jgi:hypothetical protein
MITKEFTPITGQQTTGLLNPKLLGLLGMLGSPMLFIEGFYAGFQPHGTDQVVAWLEIGYTTAWLCSIVGLYLTQATGKGKLGKALLGIQFISVLTAALWTASHIVAPNLDTNSTLYIATDLSWPFSHVFMIVVGIATLVAKNWTGWARFTPLLCGLTLPVAILSSIVLGETALGIVFGLGTTIAFALLGYAVRTQAQETAN